MSSLLHSVANIRHYGCAKATIGYEREGVTLQTTTNIQETMKGCNNTNSAKASTCRYRKSDKMIRTKLPNNNGNILEFVTRALLYERCCIAQNYSNLIIRWGNDCWQWRWELQCLLDPFQEHHHRHWYRLRRCRLHYLMASWIRTIRLHSCFAQW